jgi:hypothetical protein
MQYAREYKMMKHPSVKATTINSLRDDYGASFFKLPLLVILCFTLTQMQLLELRWNILLDMYISPSPCFLFSIRSGIMRSTPMAMKMKVLPLIWFTVSLRKEISGGIPCQDILIQFLSTVAMGERRVWKVCILFG